MKHASPYLIARIADCDLSRESSSIFLPSTPYLIARIADCDKFKQRLFRWNTTSLSYCTHSGLRRHGYTPNYPDRPSPYLIARIADCDTVTWKSSHSSFSTPYLIARIADCDFYFRQEANRNTKAPYLIARIADCDKRQLQKEEEEVQNSLSYCTHSGLRHVKEKTLKTILSTPYLIARIADCDL